MCLALLLLMPTAALRRFHIHLESAVFRWWSRTALRIYGVRVETVGSFSREPGIVVSNHISYWDIVALGARYGAVFVAKSEVAGWPIIGWAARLLGTIFVSRRDRHGAVRKLNKAFVSPDFAGREVVIFPEGTTSATPCLEFKSGAFHLAHRSGLILKPVALVYDDMELMAWLGDDSLGGHLWRLTFVPGCVCTIVELPVVDPKDFDDPVALKEACRSAIQKGVDAALRGQAESLLSLGEVKIRKNDEDREERSKSRVSSRSARA